MEKEVGCFKIWTEDDDRRIVYSKGSGVAHAHEIEWLYEGIIELASQWNDEKGWVYMAFIEDLIQVSPKGSSRYVELHKTCCTYFADEVSKISAPILGNGNDIVLSADNQEKLIAVSAVLSGFAHLLTEKLLLL